MQDWCEILVITEKNTWRLSQAEIVKINSISQDYNSKPVSLNLPLQKFNDQDQRDHTNFFIVNLQEKHNIVGENLTVST